MISAPSLTGAAAYRSGRSSDLDRDRPRGPPHELGRILPPSGPGRYPQPQGSAPYRALSAPIGAPEATSQGRRLRRIGDLARAVEDVHRPGARLDLLLSPPARIRAVSAGV